MSAPLHNKERTLEHTPSGLDADHNTPEIDGMIDRATHYGSEAIEIARQFIRPLFLAAPKAGEAAE